MRCRSATLASVPAIACALGVAGPAQAALDFTPLAEKRSALTVPEATAAACATRLPAGPASPRARGRPRPRATSPCACPAPGATGTSPTGTFGPAGSCRRTPYMAAKGTSTWSFVSRAALPAGRYLAWVRAIDAARNVERKTRRRNLVTFTVR